MGATYPASLSQVASGAAVPAPQLADSDQLQLRYDAPSSTYEIQLPQSQAWVAVFPIGTGPDKKTADGSVTLTAVPGGTLWSGPTSFGVISYGTPAPTVPTTGSASYRALLAGYSSEKSAGAPGTIGGGASFTFNFSSGSLVGTFSPTLTLGQTYVLPTLTIKDGVHAVGSPTFSGKFDSTLAGQNSFSGMFNGSWLHIIGNFAFPYASPVDGMTQQAAGAFSGTRRPTTEP